MAATAAGLNRRFSTIVTTLLLAASLVVALAPPAAAATFDVTRLDDPAPDGCTPDDCSLREAVIAANVVDGPDTAVDTIVLDAGTYTLTIPAAVDDFHGLDDAASGDLDIWDTVVVQGAGADEVVIDARPMGSGGGTFHTGLMFRAGLTVTGVTLLTGSEDPAVARSGIYLQGGAGEDRDGELTEWQLADLIFLGARPGAGSAGGGGLVADAGRPGRIVNSSFIGNEAEASGGALRIGHPDADVTVLASTFSDNSAQQGGAIAVSIGALTLENSAVTDNTASSAGGGLVARGSAATVDVVNTTISGNSAPFGGGIVAVDGGNFLLRHVTVAGNTADNGAALHAFGTGSTITASNTAVGGTTGGVNCIAEAGGAIPSGIGNLGDDGSCLYSEVSDLELGDLADNGGRTLTHLPDAGSPLIDAGAAGACTSTDQRLEPRDDGACDVAAVERQDDEGGDDPDPLPPPPPSPPPDDGTAPPENDDERAPVADLHVNISTVGFGPPFLVSVEVGNRGPDTAEQVVLDVVLQAENISDVTTPEGCDVVGNPGVPGAFFTCELGFVLPEETHVRTFGVIVGQGRCGVCFLSVRAEVRSDTGDPNHSDNTQDTQIAANPPGEWDLRLAAEILAGSSTGATDKRLRRQDLTAAAEPLVLEVTTRNDEPDTAEDVQLRIDLDPTLEVTGFTTEGSCSTADDGLDCTLPDLPAGGESIILVGLQPTALGPVSATARIVGIFGLDVDPDDAAQAIAAGNAVPAFEQGSVVRVAGPGRVETAIAASQQAFDEGRAGAVVLARADEFADALAGAPLAAALGAPLLLTPPTALPAAVEAELARVLPAGGFVVLLGGTAALDPAIEERLAALGYAVTRHAGGDRFATAVAVADQLGDVERVLLADGTDFADALPAAAVAAARDGAVVFTSGDALPAATAAYVDAHPDAVILAVGGPAAAALPTAPSVVGATRFDTAALLAGAFFPEPTVAGLASGEDFPDALVAAAQLGRYDGPLLLSASTDLPDVVGAYFRDHDVRSIVLFGGPAALSAAVEAEAVAALAAD